METVIQCPSCQKRYKLPAGVTAASLKCPSCGTAIPLTAPETAAVAPAPATSAILPSQMVANRAVAGRTCGICARPIALGQTVRNCEKCGNTFHVECWNARGGCGTANCANAPLPQMAAAPVAAAQAVASPATKQCPFCAEQIPAASRICPVCSEALVEGGNLPKSFAARGFGKWNFAIVRGELVGVKGGKEIRVSSERAALDITVQKRRFRITHNGKVHKFIFADDFGPIVVDFWRNGTITPQPSYMASQALSSSIIGIFCAGIILQPMALYYASIAAKNIRAYPGLLTGQGKVLAARIIAGTCLGLIALYIIIIVMSAGK